MAYDVFLADRVRAYLVQLPHCVFEEKTMFGGLAFLVKGRMCINVSRDALMCRYDPALHDEVSERPGYRPMIMKGKELAGYCYVDPVGFRSPRDFQYWMTLCLQYNERMSAPRKAKKK